MINDEGSGSVHAVFFSFFARAIVCPGSAPTGWLHQSDLPPGPAETFQSGPGDGYFPCLSRVHRNILVADVPAASMLSSSRAFPPILAVALVVCIGAVHGIRCYRCGQYNEGVGSITPCINYTAQMLTECSSTDEWCIKYVSEGSTVRDCVTQCVEKEAWSTRTYCCQQDGCNSGPSLTASSSAYFVLAISLVVLLVCRSLRG